MTDKQMIRDILYKAAEDVQQGMWCRGVLFRMDCSADEIYRSNQVRNYVTNNVERCAEGSINLAGAMLGGSWEVSDAAILHVTQYLPEICGEVRRTGNGETVECDTLYHHNDHHMEGMTSFEAGQHLSELFRMAADRL